MTPADWTESAADRELVVDPDRIASALSRAGADDKLRSDVLDLLRDAQLRSTDPQAFESEVRWPLVHALVAGAPAHRVQLSNGLVVEVGADSRIDRAFLLSTCARPDHVWEPQTTRLLVRLAAGVRDVIVGGAYIGDHALLVARELAAGPHGGRVHAFEPVAASYERLVRNLEINGIANVTAVAAALWSRSDAELTLSGPLALATSAEVPSGAGGSAVQSVAIDDYAEAEGLEVGLIMLDVEGAEEHALQGAHRLLEGAKTLPNLVFEIHRDYVDWSAGLEKTSIVSGLQALGYELFGVRDLHGNRSLPGPIEVVPVAETYLQGPPHGFNVLATRDAGLIDRLGLKVVRGVSPKLIPGRDPALFAPTGGWGEP